MTFFIYKGKLSAELIKGFLLRFAVIILFLINLSFIAYAVYIHNNQKVLTVIVDPSKNQNATETDRMEDLATTLLPLVTYLTPSNCEQRTNRYLSYVIPTSYQDAHRELNELCSYIRTSQISIVYDYEIAPFKRIIKDNKAIFIFTGLYTLSNPVKIISSDNKKFYITIFKKNGEYYIDTVKPYEPNITVF